MPFHRQIKDGISAKVVNTCIKNEMEHYLGYGASGHPDVDVCKRALEEIQDVIAPGRHRVEMTIVYQSILTRCLSLFKCITQPIQHSQHPRKAQS
jgi:hypothetical protein